jgi:hypothetical protein
MNGRSLCEKHFGKEAVLWAAGDGPEPTNEELAAELADRCLRAEAAAWARGVARRLQIAREIEMAERALRGEIPGLTEEETALLPELLRLLQAEREALS